MAAHKSCRNSDGSPPPSFYFAYGSNLHMKQMAKRCPNSKYIGRARLPDYRWQINERGYANVIECQGHWVDGLVYEIDEKDEAKLDVNEGVPKNAYTKHYETVLLHRAKACLYRRPVSWIVDKGGPAAVLKIAGEHSRKLEGQNAEDVLVYISLNHVEDSAPRLEYVERINLGLVDAKILGFEDDYIRNCIRPFIPRHPDSCTDGRRVVAASSHSGEKRNPSNPTTAIHNFPNASRVSLQSGKLTA